MDLTAPALKPIVPGKVSTIRLAIVVSHPIQHFAPFYRALAKEPSLAPLVVYASRIGAESYFDKDMNTEIRWNMDLLGGYEHVFLPEAGRIKATGPLQVNNPSVGAELARINPDAVLIYGYSQLTSIRALAWCRRNKVPAIMISDSELKQHRSTKVNFAKRLLLPLLLRQFTCFLTVGDCNEDYYRHYGIDDKRLFRSPFTIDEDSYRTIQQNRHCHRAEVRAALGIADGDLVALTVGKLSERKRVRDVLSVARAMKTDRRARGISFLLAGNGSLMEEFRCTVEAENLPVKLLGFVNVDHLPKVYAAADLIVHPSSRDPHPLVLSEAACIGLPVIISDRVGAAGPTDIARPGENAIVVPCRDVASLATAVRLLADDPQLGERMGASSQRIYGELDMKRSVDGLLQAVRYCVCPAASMDLKA